jgi:hypothetical protein
MPSHILPPNPCLVSVLLVVRSRDGPRFVFHYPPHPDSNVSRQKPRYGVELDATSCHESDEYDSDSSDLEDGGFVLKKDMEKVSLNQKTKINCNERHVDPWEGDDHYESADGTQVVPWERFGEFDTRDLESILTPAKPFHKQKFQLSLDPLYFVTYPIHRRDDSFWRKKKKEKRKQFHRISAQSVTSTNEREAESPKDEDPNDKAKQESEKTNDNGGMTMFNVVFVTNPPHTESSDRNQDIFQHVAKNINKALKYAQAESNYVWEESELILGLKEKAREESESSGTNLLFFYTSILISP